MITMKPEGRLAKRTLRKATFQQSFHRAVPGNHTTTSAESRKLPGLISPSKAGFS